MTDLLDVELLASSFEGNILENVAFKLISVDNVDLVNH